MKDKENLGMLINEARKRKGITQQELAEKLNISDKAVSNWETGKNLPDYDMVKRIEKILDIEIFEQIENKKSTFKIRLLSILIFCLAIPLVFFTTFFINNYNKTNIYTIKLDSQTYNIKDSYLIVTKNNVIINLGEFTRTDYPYQPEYFLTLYYKKNDTKQIIIAKENYNYLTIAENKSDYIKLDKDFLDNIDNLYINIKYIDFKGRKIEQDIKLNLTKIKNDDKISSSNKKKYPNFSSKVPEYLKNNSYKIIDEGIYQKTYDHGTFTCDVINEEFYYQGIMGNKEVYVSIVNANSSNINYIIFDHGTLIEQYLTGEDDPNNMQYYYEVRNIITTEEKKIGI